MLLLPLLLAFAAASQNTVSANGQSERDTNIPNGITQQYQQNIIENIEKRLLNVVNELAAIHRQLHQEQHAQINFLQRHVQINFLQEAQVREKLKIKPKLPLGKFCY